jgi:hypothetical protein
MWWISFCNRIRGLYLTIRCSSTFRNSLAWLSTLWKPRPPERIDRPTGRHKHFKRELQYQQALRELAAGPTIIDRILGRSPPLRQRKLLLRALQIAATLSATHVPVISLGGDRIFRNQLRRYKRRGFLGTTNLKQEDMTRLRQVLAEYEPQSLYSSTAKDSFHLIVDSGCSHSATSCPEDFIPGTLRDLTTPVEMEGIAGGLVIRQKGRVRFELLTDDGEVHVLETTAYLMPELPCRLFSPQAHFQEQYRTGFDPRESANLALQRNRGVITWENGSKTTLSFCETTHLPRLRVYRNALDSGKALALKGCVTDEVNQNLSAKQKLLLRFHF